MSTRTFDEIKESFRLARLAHDIAQLEVVKDEFEAFNSTEALALSKRAQATILGLQGNYHAQLEYLFEALGQCEETGDGVAIATTTGELGLAYWRIGDVATALEYMHKALELHEDLGNLEGLAANTNNIGIIYSDTADYAKALEYYHRALALHVQVGNRFYQANTTGNIGSVYQSINDLPAAMEYAQRAIALHQELGDRAGEANGLASIGGILSLMERDDEAETWIRRGNDVAVEFGLSQQQAYSSMALANLLAKLKRFDEAIKILDDNDSLFQQHAAVLTGSIKIRAGILAKQNDTEAARELFLVALEQTAKRNERSSMADINKSLRDISKTLGDLDSYVKYNEIYLELTNEISGADTTRRLAMQEKEREIELDRLVRQKEKEEQERTRQELERERERERSILYGALPQHVADRLIRGETVTDHYDDASVMFLDIAGFTRISSRVPAGHVVHLLDAIFGACDEICQKYGITKIKTIGDSYMAMGMENLEFRMENGARSHVHRIANAAIEIQEYLATMQVRMPPELGDTSWTKEVGDIYARVGLHCGPVVAGIVGKDRLQYDVWGDTVNVASRMESTGEPGRVQVSEQFAQTLDENSLFKLEPRVAQEVKGKGMMQTFWLERT